MAKFLDDVREYSWKEVFEKSGFFLVPIFQRPYIWNDEKVKRYLDTIKEILDDIEDEEKHREKFIGNIVLKDNNGNFEIIDGQQRFTTTSLIIKAILKIANEQIEKTKELGNESNINVSILENLKNTITYRDYLKFNSGNRELRLKPLYFQSDFWHKIMSDYEDSIEDKDFEDSFYKKNFDIIYSEIDSYITTDGVMNYQTLDKIFDIVINKMKIIYVFLANDKNEFEIFETLNSLGQPLGVADLVKNKLLESEKPEHSEIYIKYWQPIFEKENYNFWKDKGPELKNDDTNIEIFFKYYMTILIDSDSAPKKDELYKKYSNYFNDNKDILTNKEMAEDLRNYAKQYLHLIDKNSKLFESHPKTMELVSFMRTVKTSVYYPIIMFYKQNVKTTQEVESLSSLLLSYIVRRLCCKLDNKSMNNNLFSILKKAKRDNKDVYLVLEHELRQNLQRDSMQVPDTSRYPTDGELVKELQENCLSEDVARAILTLLEKRLKAHTFTDINEKSKGSLTLEHIVPRKPERWENVELDTLYKIERHKKLSRNIGNLTLLEGKRNTKASNKHWNEKKEFYRNSNLELNKLLMRDFPDFNREWDKSIKTRSNVIAKLIRDNFK